MYQSDTGRLLRKPLYLLLFAILLLQGSANAQSPIDYDLVYVKAPRLGDETNTRWPEVFDPIHMEAGANLMLLHPDGSEELLFPGGNGSVVDPVVSFDGLLDLFFLLSRSPTKCPEPATA